MTNNNPAIPDMVADPSIIEIDGTFYCYSTTDGYNQGLVASGPPVVWKSGDLINWSFNGLYFPSAAKQKYWAPSTVKERDGKYYIYPTINTNIHVGVANNPAGPFHLANGPDTFGTAEAALPLVLTNGPKKTKGIDAEVFIDDDGKAYMYWAQRGAARLMDDMITLDTAIIVIPTKRQGYSEGPFMFRRNGIYYYLYTLSGHENYQYAYMYSKVSPLGPFISPENDIIATTDHSKMIYGPGHGSVFNDHKTSQYYFAYLEFGNGSTNRQVYIDKMEFNADGTIKPVILTHTGISLPVPGNQPLNMAIGKNATALSVLPELSIMPEKDPTFSRRENYFAKNASDGSKGTRWMADTTKTENWITIDLGTVKKVNRTEAYFVKPAAGHAYKLSYSSDAIHWKVCGGHDDLRIQSPHTDLLNIRARYLKITILKGAPGLWEWEVY